jgi:hypothetical protein
MIDPLDPELKAYAELDIRLGVDVRLGQCVATPDRVVQRPSSHSIAPSAVMPRCLRVIHAGSWSSCFAYAFSCRARKRGSAADRLTSTGRRPACW